ncbi:MULTISPECIES: metallophosphoesterase [Salinibaculum]|uniref:metallophosphoesterase n=1 Tax=Salinibaculum TaxID=2732368 RepID=UPI0030D3D640
MTGRILVAGDVHLGSEHADVDAFNSFLQAQSRNQHSVDHLVLLGDVWDLIRRDPFGVAWETSETITHLKRLASEVPVHFVFGNHDTHLRHLDRTLYDVEFRNELVLGSGDHDIRFCHGEAFDRFQSDALSKHLSGPGDRGDIDPTRGLKDPVVAWGRELVQTQKRRLKRARTSVLSGDDDGEVYPRRERRAHAYLDAVPEDKLVYGHTHRPYVRPDNAVANPGTWKASAPDSNTYLVIDDGAIALYRHVVSGPDEPVNAGAAAAVPADD